MALIIYSNIVLLSSIILYVIEKKKEIIVTPILLLGIPYSILLVYSILISIIDPLYNQKVSILLPIISITYIFLFFQAGKIVKALFYGRYYKIKSEYSYKVNEIKNFKIYYSIIFILFSLIFITYIKKFGINSNITNNFIMIKSQFNTGIIAHMINITNAIIIILFSDALVNYYNTNKFYMPIIPICIVWILFLVVGTAKYTLMMFIGTLVIIYARIFPKKIRIHTTILCIILFLMLFILVYVIRFISQGLSISEIPFKFIFSHLNHYLVSPFYAFSSVIENNIIGHAGIGIIFAPIINIINVILGEPVISTIAEFINIGNGLNSTNVFTLFGAIQYEVGFITTVIMLIMLSFFIYYLYYKNIYTPSSVNIALYSYMGSSLLISFFNCFYGTLSVWENIIVMMLVIGLEKYKFIIRKGV